MLARTPQSPRSAYRTIGEVAVLLNVPVFRLRYLEARIPEISPLRRGSGERTKRLYRPEDVELLNGIEYLMSAEGYSIRGVQKFIRTHGVQAVRDSVPSN
jgi:DNA-binding transcriptional MerR regulator